MTDRNDKSERKESDGKANHPSSTSTSKSTTSTTDTSPATASAHKESHKENLQKSSDASGKHQKETSGGPSVRDDGKDSQSEMERATIPFTPEQLEAIEDASKERERRSNLTQKKSIIGKIKSSLSTVSTRSSEKKLDGPSHSSVSQVGPGLLITTSEAILSRPSAYNADRERDSTSSEEQSTDSKTQLDDIEDPQHSNHEIIVSTIGSARASTYSSLTEKKSFVGPTHSAVSQIGPGLFISTSQAVLSTAQSTYDAEGENDERISERKSKRVEVQDPRSSRPGSGVNTMYTIPLTPEQWEAVEEASEKRESWVAMNQKRSIMERIKASFSSRRSTRASSRESKRASRESKRASRESKRASSRDSNRGPTHDSTRDSTHDSTRDSTRGPTHGSTHSTRDSTRDSTHDSTRDSTRGPTHGSTHSTRDSTRGSTHDSTRDSTHDSTRGSTHYSTHSTRDSTNDSSRDSTRKSTSEKKHGRRSASGSQQSEENEPSCMVVSQVGPGLVIRTRHDMLAREPCTAIVDIMQYNAQQDDTLSDIENSLHENLNASSSRGKMTFSSTEQAPFTTAQSNAVQETTDMESGLTSTSRRSFLKRVGSSFSRKKSTPDEPTFYIAGSSETGSKNNDVAGRQKESDVNSKTSSDDKIASFFDDVSHTPSERQTNEETVEEELRESSVTPKTNLRLSTSKTLDGTSGSVVSQVGPGLVVTTREDMLADFRTDARPSLKDPAPTAARSRGSSTPYFYTWKISRIFPTRCWFAFLAHVGFAIIYGLKVNISVAIVAMVIPKDAAAVVASECEAGDQSGAADTGPGKKYDWDESVQGHILGSYFYGYLVSQIPGAILADMYGSKWVMFVAVLANVLGCVLTPPLAYVHWGLVVVDRVIQGIGAGVTFPAMHTMISNWAPPKERSIFTGTIYAGLGIGMVGSTLIAGYVTVALGWDIMFYIMGALCVPWLVVWILFVEDYPRQEVVDASGKFTAKVIKTDAEHKNSLTFPAKQVFASLPFWAILVAHFGGNCGLYCMITQVPTFMKNVLHKNLKDNALLSTIPYIAFFVVASSVGPALDWGRQKNTITTTTARRIASSLCMVIPAGCLVGLSFIGCNVVLGVFWFSLAVGAVGAQTAGYLGNHIDIAPSYAGILMGITNTIATVPGIAIPIIIGYVTLNNHTLARWSLIFYVIAVLYILTWIFYMVFCSGNVQPWDEKSKDENEEREEPGEGETGV